MTRAVLASHTNTEGERIAVERITDPTHPFGGRAVLVLYDDPPPLGSGIGAPMLLDSGARAWLRGALDLADQEAPE